MSDIYVQRLRNVRDEYETASRALLFVREQWHRQEVSDYFAPRSRYQIIEAEANLQLTYFVRLTAAFEGILRDHLRTNHPKVKFPTNRANWKMDWFLTIVCRKENITIPPMLRSEIERVRDTRNLLAHGELAAQMTLAQALSVYNSFLNRLPEPFR